MTSELKTSADEYQASGQPFRAGARVTCYIFKDDSGQLQRIDFLESETGTHEIPKNFLARWTRIVKERNEEIKEAKKRSLDTAESIFLSLFEEESESSTDKEALQQVLALFLERKRILKRVASEEKTIQHYYHAGTGNEFRVPMDTLEPERIIQLEDELQKLIF